MGTGRASVDWGVGGSAAVVGADACADVATGRVIANGDVGGSAAGARWGSTDDGWAGGGRSGGGWVEVGRGEAKDVAEDVVGAVDLVVDLLQDLQVVDAMNRPPLAPRQPLEDPQHRLRLPNGVRARDGHRDPQPMADCAPQHLRALQRADGATRTHGCVLALLRRWGLSPV